MAQTVDDRAQFDAALSAIRAAGSAKSLAVGIFDGIVASYALAHEVEVGWFRATIDSERYVEGLEKLIDAALRGDDVDSEINALGDAVVEDLKAAVEAAGLVETGTMRDSIEAKRGEE